jgi:hypothetical protein
VRASWCVGVLGDDFWVEENDRRFARRAAVSQEKFKFPAKIFFSFAGLEELILVAI